MGTQPGYWVPKVIWTRVAVTGSLVQFSLKPPSWLHTVLIVAKQRYFFLFLFDKVCKE